MWPRQPRAPERCACLLDPGPVRKKGPSKGTGAMISLADLQRRIDSGELSPDAAIARSREAVDAQNKTIGAFVCRSDNPRAASTGRLRGIAV